MQCSFFLMSSRSTNVSPSHCCRNIRPPDLILLFESTCTMKQLSLVNKLRYTKTKNNKRDGVTKTFKNEVYFLPVYTLEFQYLANSTYNVRHIKRTVHTRLTMYYNRLLLYDIVTVTLQFRHGFSTKCIGDYTMCMCAHRI